MSNRAINDLNNHHEAAPLLYCSKIILLLVQNRTTGLVVDGKLTG